MVGEELTVVTIEFETGASAVESFVVEGSGLAEVESQHSVFDMHKYERH